MDQARLRNFAGIIASDRPVCGSNVRLATVFLAHFVDYDGILEANFRLTSNS